MVGTKYTVYCNCETIKRSMRFASQTFYICCEQHQINFDNTFRGSLCKIHKRDYSLN